MFLCIATCFLRFNYIVPKPLPSHRGAYKAQGGALTYPNLAPESDFERNRASTLLLLTHPDQGLHTFFFSDISSKLSLQISLISSYLPRKNNLSPI